VIQIVSVKEDLEIFAIC